MLKGTDTIMDISRKQLIRIIKQKSLIWDRTNPGYRDKVQRELAWKEVYNAVEPDFETLPKSVQSDIANQITKRWYNLRDAYVKSRKKSKRPHLNTDMSFLDTFYYHVDENISGTDTNVTDDFKKIEETYSLEDFNGSQHSDKDVFSFMKGDTDDNNEKTSKQRITAASVNILKAKSITVDLIKLVEGKTLLWDKTSPSYRDKVKREEAWRSIFKAIEPSYELLDQSDKNEVGDYITRKWNNVRDAYLKNIKNHRPYMYGDMLKFLNPHILDLNYSEIEYFKGKEQQNEEDSFSLANSEGASLDDDDDCFEIPAKKSKFELDSGVGSASDLNERISTRQLISVIKKERSLWDKTCSSYNNKFKREESWKAVYKDIVPNFDELSKDTQREIGYGISKKWYKVKNNYYKYLKNGVGKRSGVFSKMLRFLDCQYISESNLETEFVNTNDLITFDGNQINTDDVARQIKKEFLQVDGNIFEAEFEKTCLDSTLEMADHEININKEGEKKLLAMLSNLIAREDDEDKSFFNAILSSVKSLSDDSKLMFRMNVLKLIQALKKRDRDQIFIKQEPM